MTTVLTNIQEVTPEWLTNLFRQKGLLYENRVIDVQITASNATNVSEVYFLQIGYLLAATDAPRRLFVKLPKPDKDWRDKEIELEIPSQDLRKTDSPPETFRVSQSLKVWACA